MKMLLKEKADAAARDGKGKTALFLCSSPPVAELLSENRCDVNVRENSGQTALFSAARRGLVDVTRTLLKLRCEIDAADTSGETSLFQSARYHHAEVYRVLVEGGAEVSRRSHQGLMATDKTSLPSVKKLLPQQMKSGDTPKVRKRGLETGNGVGCTS